MNDGYIGNIVLNFSYKGLTFPLSAESRRRIENEIAFGGEVNTIPLYAYYGYRFMTTTEIREEVGRMIERRLYQPPQRLGL